MEIKKKETIDLIRDSRFKWVLASADEKINDGLMIDLEDNAREKFLEETGAKDFNIMDYVDFLEESKETAMRVLEESDRELVEALAEVKALEKTMDNMNTLKYSFQTIYYSMKMFIKGLLPLKYKRRGKK